MDLTTIPPQAGLTAKIARIMKLTSVILLTACLAASAGSNGQNVTFSGKNVSLEEVFTVIKQQTGYVFFYSYSLLEKAKPISLEVRDRPVKEVLDICFANQPIGYVLEDRTITLTAKPTGVFDPPVTTSDPLPPLIDIRGRIVNENGEPVAGATITVKGTKIATATNSNGEFQLNGVDDNATLVITGTNIETFEVKVANNPGLMSGDGLTLTAKIKQAEMQEVIINKGYYTEKMRNTVGNVATIKAADIEKQPVQNPLLALAGRVPGLEVTQLTGLPGGGVKVQIQGVNTLRHHDLEVTSPLVVIDGVIYPTQLKFGNYQEGIIQTGSPLNYINPSDIESIDILKDADATAIYGSRAANGAILITTKKGKAGRAKLSINLQEGWGKVTRHLDMMNTRQYLDMRYEAFRNAGVAFSNPLVAANDLKL